MPDGRSHLEERRHIADEAQMISDHRAPADVLFGVMRDSALRLAQRREVVKLHLRALYSQRLRFHQSSISSVSDRRSGTITSGACDCSSSKPIRPVATAIERIPLAFAART